MSRSFTVGIDFGPSFAINVIVFLGSGQSPVEWGEIPYIRSFIRSFVRPPPSGPSSQVLGPANQPAGPQASGLVSWAAGLAGGPQAWLVGLRHGWIAQMGGRTDGGMFLLDVS